MSVVEAILNTGDICTRFRFVKSRNLANSIEGEERVRQDMYKDIWRPGVIYLSSIALENSTD